jgi:tetratricopeptide (TPR) repeat protein
MDPQAAPARTPWLVIGLMAGAIGLGIVGLAAAATWYILFMGNTPHSQSVEKTIVQHPELAEKARVPDDMRETAREAADHFKNSEYEVAAGCYQRIIDKYPESLYAWSNLGVVRFQQGEFDEAKTALLQAVQLSPDDVFSISNLGITYYQLNQYAEAIGCLEKAVALAPDDAKSHNYLGCCYAQKGESAKSEGEFEKAIDLDPRFSDAYFNLSLVYAMAHPPDVEMAKIYYRQALDLGMAKDPRMEKLISREDDGK